MHGGDHGKVPVSEAPTQEVGKQVTFVIMAVNKVDVVPQDNVP
jgi:hypothetical protein